MILKTELEARQARNIRKLRAALRDVKTRLQSARESIEYWRHIAAQQTSELSQAQAALLKTAMLDDDD